VRVPGRIRLARGEVNAALQDATRALELARDSGDAQHLDPALGFAARVLLTAGRAAETKVLDELLTTVAERVLNPDLGVDLAVDLAKLGHPASELDAVPPSPWREAAHALSPVILHVRPASTLRSAPGLMRLMRDSKRPTGSSPAGAPPRPMPSW